MDDLNFFNEREAECFEREDTLSSSELEKLQVDEDLSEMKRAEHLLCTGLERQKISILATLPGILASNPDKGNVTLILDCVKALWQPSQSEAEMNNAMMTHIFQALGSLACTTVDGNLLPILEVCLHEEYCERMEEYRAMREDAVFLLSEEQLMKQLVPFILELITEVQQKDIAEAASLAIIATLPRLKATLKKTQIIRVAMEKGDVTQPPGSRLVCSLLLGAITAMKLLSSQDVEGIYFSKMLAMCQDTDAEVRRSMCIQLDALARTVGEKKASADVLPELLELLLDEEKDVKHAAFMCLLSLFDYFTEVERYNLILPALLDVAHSLQDDLVTCFAEKFGILVTKVAAFNYLVDDTATGFLQSFSQLCVHEEDQIREYCAFNFPAVVQAFKQSYLPLLMDDLMIKLSRDTLDTVRHHIAAGIHAVAEELDEQKKIRYVKPVFLELIRDEDARVQNMALTRLPTLLPMLLSSCDDDQKACLLDTVLKAVSHHHATLPPSLNRHQMEFIKMLDKFSKWCSTNQLHDIINPIIFDLVENGAKPVQLLGMKTLIASIRRNEDAVHRHTLLGRVRTEFGQARSHWRRMLYLEACVFALEINSRQYFYRNFLDIAIDMLDDAVPNIRWKAALQLPVWRRVLVQVNDDKLLDRVHQFLEEAVADSDRDVCIAASDAKQVIEAEEYDQSSRQSQEDEAEDRRQATQEEHNGLSTDHEDSAADAKWSSMLEYTLVVGKDGQVVRRARVKSFDLATKLARAPAGKDSSRGAGSLTGSTSNHIARSDGNRSKVNSASKLSARPLPYPSSPGLSNTSTTTLPNCGTGRSTTIRPSQGSRSANATGKFSTGIARMPNTARTSSSSKDAPLTKIPNIRPTAPTKRESTPPGSHKGPSSIGSSGNRLGTVDSTTNRSKSNTATAGKR